MRKLLEGSINGYMRSHIETWRLNSRVSAHNMEWEKQLHDAHGHYNKMQLRLTKMCKGAAVSMLRQRLTALWKGSIGIGIEVWAQKARGSTRKPAGRKLPDFRLLQQ